VSRLATPSECGLTSEYRYNVAGDKLRRALHYALFIVAFSAATDQWRIQDLVSRAEPHRGVKYEFYRCRWYQTVL